MTVIPPLHWSTGSYSHGQQPNYREVLGTANAKRHRCRRINTQGPARPQRRDPRKRISYFYSSFM